MQNGIYLKTAVMNPRKYMDKQILLYNNVDLLIFFPYML